MLSILVVAAPSYVASSMVQCDSEVALQEFRRRMVHSKTCVIHSLKAISNH